MTEKPSAKDFGEIFKSTSGTQFYGPTAALAFLTELRTRARVLQSRFMYAQGGTLNQEFPPSLSMDNILGSSEAETTSSCCFTVPKLS